MEQRPYRLSSVHYNANRASHNISYEWLTMLALHANVGQVICICKYISRHEWLTMLALHANVGQVICICKYISRHVSYNTVIWVRVYLQFVVDVLETVTKWTTQRPQLIHSKQTHQTHTLQYTRWHRNTSNTTTAVYTVVQKGTCQWLATRNT